MKLPIQSQPVLRNVSPVRIYENPAKYVNASDCNSQCAWMVGSCIPGALVAAATGGPVVGYATFTGCLAAVSLSSDSCRDCVSSFAQEYWKALGQQNCIGPRCQLE